jgi:hypothetical protein
VLELPTPRPKVSKVEQEITRLVPKLGIPYENGGPVPLGVKGVVDAAKDRIGPLCDVEVVETMVVGTNDDGLGGESSLVVTTIVGI